MLNITRQLSAAVEAQKSGHGFHPFRKARSILITPQIGRFISAERDLGIPVRFVYVLLVFLYLFYGFSDEVAARIETIYEETLETYHEDTLNLAKKIFLIYVVMNFIYFAMLLNSRRIPFRIMLYGAFTMALLDGLMFCCLIVIEDGFSSSFFWVYFGMILRNAYAVSDAFFQLTLNISVVLMYTIGGIFGTRLLRYDELRDSLLTSAERGMDDQIQHILEQQIIDRMILLTVLVLFCFAFQVLFDRQRRLREEQLELSIRNEHLKGMGRLAAEIAHQLKNPLSIISNASYNLQKNPQNQELLQSQSAIIRDEIRRSDSILKNLIHDASDSVSPVRKLNLRKVIDEAVLQAVPREVFPAVKVVFESPVNPEFHLLMQSRHLSEILVNLLVNAREAMNNDGQITIHCGRASETSLFISITDAGPGIPAKSQIRIFEAFFSTKPNGTGLGLGIVKKYVELYGGFISLDSSPSGTRFQIVFPEKLSTAHIYEK